MSSHRFTATVCTLAVAASTLTAGLALPQAASAKPLGGLFSCDAGGGKQEVGGVLGAGAGALLGSQISKNERGLGAVVGAAAGAVIGSKIGCAMQSTDKARAESATKKALDKGVSQTWSNPETGASGQVTVLSSDYGPPVDGRAFRYAPGVRQLASYSPLDGQYATTTRLMLRASASKKGAVLGRLETGERFDALGTAPGGWVLAGRDGYAIGYLSRAYVQPMGGGSDASCRTIETSTRTTGYRAQIERYNACRDKSGEWQLTQI
jgi:surface antigen